MSSFNLYEYISYILINNENTSSGKELTPVKTTLLPGLARVIVVASLPTNPSRDVTLKIPINTFAKLEAQAPCVVYRNIIAILHCFSVHEKYTNVD